MLRYLALCVVLLSLMETLCEVSGEGSNQTLVNPDTHKSLIYAAFPFFRNNITFLYHKHLKTLELDEIPASKLVTYVSCVPIADFYKNSSFYF